MRESDDVQPNDDTEVVVRVRVYYAEIYSSIVYICVLPCARTGGVLLFLAVFWV